MKNFNIGIVNQMISEKLKDSYFNNNLVDSKKITDFFDVVKNSPILQLEFKVYNNIENKHIDNDLIATRYIDNNIKLFEVYTIDEIDKERLKLKPFIVEDFVYLDSKKVEVYNAIDTLIQESLNDYDKVNVDDIHEAFTVVLNHIKEPKIKLIENTDYNLINEDIIQIAVDKFNEKYDTLVENDRNLLNLLIKSTDDEKQKLLETYKVETLELLEGLNKNEINDNIIKAIKKIKEMVYKQSNVDDDIISLYDLKKDIL